MPFFTHLSGAIRDKAALTLGGSLSIAVVARMLTPQPFSVTGLSSTNSIWHMLVAASVAFTNGLFLWRAFGQDVACKTRIGRISFGAVLGTVGITTTLLTILVPLLVFAGTLSSVQTSNWSLAPVMFGVGLAMLIFAEVPILLPYGFFAGLTFAVVADRAGWWTVIAHRE